MSLDKRTKLAFSVYLEGTKIRKILAYIYLSMTQYKLIKSEGSINPEYLFVISHEKIVREDHLDVFEKVFNHTQRGIEGTCEKLEYQRRLKISLNNLYKSKFNLYKLLKLQMDDVLNSINFSNIKNLTVFCDTSPLQNYIVEYCHYQNIQTLGMQHGFYPIPTNKYWRRVYMASNSNTFAAWDQQTIDLMNKYSKGRKRNFLKAGPISLDIQNENNKEYTELKKIAIYGAGVDQEEINSYLVNLSKYINSNTNLDLSFICHPYFKFIDRMKYTIKTGIKFESNDKKYDEYDCHIILNSSVWLELEQKKLKYIRLDNMYLNKDSFCDVLKCIYNIDSKIEINNYISLRIPFCESEKALDLISNCITEGKN